MLLRAGPLLLMIWGAGAAGAYHHPLLHGLVLVALLLLLLARVKSRDAALRGEGPHGGKP